MDQGQLEHVNRAVEKFIATWRMTKKNLVEQTNVDPEFLASVGRIRKSKRTNDYNILCYHLQSPGLDPVYLEILNREQWHAFQKKMLDSGIRPLAEIKQAELDKAEQLFNSASSRQIVDKDEIAIPELEVTMPDENDGLQKLVASLNPNIRSALEQLLKEVQSSEDMKILIENFRDMLESRLGSLEKLDDLLPYEEDLQAIRGLLQRVLEEMPYRNRAIKGRKALGYDN
jgi:hypothetical protein